MGVIEPDEVFLHTLKSFKQNRFEFLNLPRKQIQFMSADLVAVLLYNSSGNRFEEEWRQVLRTTETQVCPAIVIAEAGVIERIRNQSPGGYPSIHFMEKPLRIPELIAKLESISRPSAKTKELGTPPGAFSLAELVLRNRKHAE